MEKMAFESANILPDICVRFGLEDGDISESFRSKRLYVEKRLARKDNSFVLEMAKKISEDYDVSLLGQYDNKFEDTSNNIDVFISYLTMDKDYAEVITKILIGMGVPHNNIFCSSIPGQGIPLGQGFPEKIKE